jgi:hypothetical protein
MGRRCGFLCGESAELKLMGYFIPKKKDVPAERLYEIIINKKLSLPKAGRVF